MKARRPVSTVRDYRPPGAGPARTTGAPAGATRGGSLPDPEARKQAEAREHRAAARALPSPVLIAAAKDLCGRLIIGRPDTRTDEGREASWILGRRAALRGEIAARRLTAKDC